MSTRRGALSIVMVSAVLTMMTGLAEVDAYAAGSLKVSASVSKTNVTIGEKIVYEVVVSYTEPIEIVSNISIDNLSAVAVLKEFPQEIFRTGYDVTIKKQCVITCYAVGTITIPPVKVLYRDDVRVRTEKELTGDALSLTVRSVAKKSDINDIRDIKPAADVLNAVKTIVVNSVLIAVVIGICILAGMLVFHLRRRKHTKGIDLNLTPYEYAQKQLWDLKQAQLIEKGEYRMLAGEMTDVIRRFLVQEFSYDIMDLTTYELNLKLRDYGLPDTVRDRLIVFLDECDVVKFAKIIKSKERLVELLDIAGNMVKELFDYHEQQKALAAMSEVKP